LEVNSLIRLEVRRDEPIDKALKRFKRICEREGLIKTIRRAEYYEKPSERRRRKIRQRINQIRKSERQADKARKQIKIL
jgi:small subunit ribosomal protein S21